VRPARDLVVEIVKAVRDSEHEDSATPAGFELADRYSPEHQTRRGLGRCCE
jgi:hypothetical protein